MAGDPRGHTTSVSPRTPIKVLRSGISISFVWVGHHDSSTPPSQRSSVDWACSSADRRSLARMRKTQRTFDCRKLAKAKEQDTSTRRPAPQFLEWIGGIVVDHNLQALLAVATPVPCASWRGFGLGAS